MDLYISKMKLGKHSSLDKMRKDLRDNKFWGQELVTLSLALEKQKDDAEILICKVMKTLETDRQNRWIGWGEIVKSRCPK